jgi:Dyp-type peroxidase family
MTRRRLLQVGGATVAAGATGVTLAGGGGLVAGAFGVAAAEGDGSGDGSLLRLQQIQGNVLAGFNKDHQRFVFFRLGEADAARAWVRALSDEVASTQEVAAFNELFRTASARAQGEGGAPRASWTNVALTADGLAALGVPDGELTSFPEAFRQGMAARAGLLGDVHESAPAAWVGPPADEVVHGLLVLAADTASDLDGLAAHHASAMAVHGVATVFEQAGRTRADEPGHEHFGFRDGISQPGVRGFTVVEDPEEPDQGVKGQDLVWPGEFVVGYPTQVGEPSADAPDELNTAAGPVVVDGPEWTADGSYVVYRRLRQDVAGFRAFVREAAEQHGLDADVMGAKLVGRYRSGAPLEPVEGLDPSIDTTAGDPSEQDSTILDRDRINDFEFAEHDADGAVVPRGAHVRKVYPRDTQTPTGGEADTQTHRMIRRGIPFGESFDADASAGSPAAGDVAFPDDRGLVFLCYQASIEDQFEFVQTQWVNDEDAPNAGGGRDPIISQDVASRSFALPGGRPDHVALMQRFVTTTGGAYLFQPSIRALRQLGGEPRQDGNGNGGGTNRRPVGTGQGGGGQPRPAPRPSEDRGPMR